MPDINAVTWPADTISAVITIDSVTSEIAEEYVRFAETEARGRSPRYEDLALSIARDRDVLSFIESLPTGQRDPNRLLVAMCYLYGPNSSYATFRSRLIARPDLIREAIGRARIQTNDIARCAVFVPALAQMAGPVSLIEIGASAGLNLMLDRYSYDYSGHLLASAEPDPPVISCAFRGPMPRPVRLPRIAWRAGIDLAPLNVSDSDHVRWLQSMLWPEETGRRDLLSAAIKIARRHSPCIVPGDLLERLPEVVRRAQKDTTVVVFDSHVLRYIEAPRRRELASLVKSLGVTWLSNETPDRMPWLPEADRAANQHDNFVLVQDGERVLAVADPYSGWLDWVSS